MLRNGDQVNCAVSGGADSMALLWGLYLLKDKLKIHLSAVHFNHNLRGAESDADEAFVREFCNRFDIPLTVGRGNVSPGKKGLEAAARDARYAFFATLKGKIATAHTADDNAETMLMHLIRGTGLKGLGGIAPTNGMVIRPMLHITRQQVLAFLEEYHISYREDSSNQTDDFLRNRVRHHVMPLLRTENPKISENLSATAQRLRQDEEALSKLSKFETLPNIAALRTMSPALRSRVLEAFLKQCGTPEPNATHISLAESLVFSENPSARAIFPGGIMLTRRYDRLEQLYELPPLETVTLPQQGIVEFPEVDLRVNICPAQSLENTESTFTVIPTGTLTLRCRQEGDSIRLSGGTKSVKKLFADRKIPVGQRLRIPIVADDAGILGIYSIGAHRNRIAPALPALQIRFECIL
jgi:tRNA(Ile)-lysidine synthase